MLHYFYLGAYKNAINVNCRQRDSKAAIKSAAGAINSKSFCLSTLALQYARHNNNNNNNKTTTTTSAQMQSRLISLQARTHVHTGQKCIKTVRICVLACLCVRVFVETCVYGGKLMAHKIITERT